jgi:crotonobetainyl-CoA:carnitine CoA-transferase CaiB-like acyl-CoA transferase
MLPGGLCTQLMADLGADVLKVEEPERGDYMRALNPPVYQTTNRGKRSLSLDLKMPEGRDVLLALVRRSDVLVESFRPGALDRLGIGYTTVHDVNRGLVYCSITGFGQDGPYRDRAGHDINYLALAGALDVCGYADRPPVLPPIPMADLGAGGLTAAFGILAAVLRSRATGDGAHLDVSMHDGCVTWNTPLLMQLATRVPIERGRFEFGGGLPCYRVYATKDGGAIALGALEAKFWAAFCAAIDRPDLVGRQFDAGGAMTTEMERLFMARTRDEWTDILDGVDTCWSPVLRLDEVPSDPHVRARGLLQSVPRPTAGAAEPATSWQFRFPFKATPHVAPPARGAPALGEHTEAVLEELGYDSARRAALRRDGVI